MFHLIDIFVDEHFLHITGFTDTYKFIPGQFGQSILKKFFVSMYIVGITKYPLISLYYF